MAKNKDQLHALIAAVKPRLAQKDRFVQETLKGFKQNAADLYAGFAKSYDKLLEDATQLSGEESTVVTTVPDRLKYVMQSIVAYGDTVVSQAETNCVAKADIVLNGAVLAEGVSAIGILEMEKLFKEVRTMLEAVPTLDAKRPWDPDPTTDNVWRSKPVKSVRTRKTEAFTVVVEATEHHPAQYERVTKDVDEGVWTTTYLSGMVTSKKKAAMLKKCDEVLIGLKQARQRANSTDCVRRKINKEIFELIINAE